LKEKHNIERINNVSEKFYRFKVTPRRFWYVPGRSWYNAFGALERFSNTIW